MLSQVRRGNVRIDMLGHGRLGKARLYNVRSVYVKLVQFRSGYVTLVQVRTGNIRLLYFSPI